MVSNKVAHLNLPLSKQATETNLFPDINHNLISIAQLCDDDCEAVFSKGEVTIYKDKEVLLHGKRNQDTKLWHLSTDFQPESIGTLPPTTQSCNNVYATTTQKELVKYLHATAGYPVPETWIKAINKGNYTTWPGLSAKAVTKNKPKSIITAKGHLHGVRKNIRSTKPPNQPQPEPTHKKERDHKVYAATFDAPHTIATDLTGKFPVVSSQGNRYILILWDSDSNAILAEPMKNRSAAEHIRAYEVLHDYLVSRGSTPVLQKMDNEASAALQSKIHQKGLKLQLAPPDDHRTNPAERAIQTFKNHFIAIIAGADFNS